MTSPDPHDISLPASLLPADGRFGCGPSKVRPEAVRALADVGQSYLGTSHRQAPVRAIVRSVREGITSLFGLPDGWEIVLGNGGSTAFSDVATFGVIERQSQHLVFGEFSSKFAAAAAAAPQIDAPEIVESEPGTHPLPIPRDEVDVYAYTHNETSTGVAMSLQRPDGADGLVVVDATSAAGGLRWDPSQVDVYYFAPQKCFSSEGGLWIAACSPAALDRIARINASGRWCPASLDITIALENSKLDQTYNTPALATLFLLDQQLRWMNDGGGLEFAASRSDESSAILYGWAEKAAYAAPFVADPAHRSAVVGTIDLTGVDAPTVSAVLRENGVVDTDSYRKLGRNQLRIGMFPAVDPSDVEALTQCIDWVVERLG